VPLYLAVPSESLVDLADYKIAVGSLVNLVGQVDSFKIDGETLPNSKWDHSFLGSFVNAKLRTLGGSATFEKLDYKRNAGFKGCQQHVDINKLNLTLLALHGAAAISLAVAVFL